MAAGVPVILVVGDADRADRFARELESSGYSVLVAENGQQALGVMECEPVDLVLLDGQLPDDRAALLLARTMLGNARERAGWLILQEHRSPDGPTPPAITIKER